ncbi:MAG: hypothetical protein ACMZ64_08545 [Oleiphilus sp.]
MNKPLLPDARDGLCEIDRAILYCLHQLQTELNREFVPTIMLYGRVCEMVSISERELTQRIQALEKN